MPLIPHALPPLPPHAYRDRPERMDFLEVLQRFMLNTVSQIRTVAPMKPCKVRELPSPQVFRFWQLGVERAAAAVAAALRRSGGKPSKEEAALLRDCFMLAFSYSYIPAIRMRILHSCQLEVQGSGTTVTCRDSSCHVPGCKGNRLEVQQQTYESLHVRDLEQKMREARQKRPVNVADFFGSKLGCTSQAGGIVLDLPAAPAPGTTTTTTTKLLQLHMVHHKNEARLRRNGNANPICVTMPHSLAVLTHQYIELARGVYADGAAPANKHSLLFDNKGGEVDSDFHNYHFGKLQAQYRAPWLEHSGLRLTCRDNRYFYCGVRLRDLLKELRDLPAHVGLEADAYVLGNSFDTIVSSYADTGSMLAAVALERVAKQRQAIEDELEEFMDMEEE